MNEYSAEKDALAEAVADLRLWMRGKRSMTNYIVGSLGGHEGDSEIERRLIWEADTAQIVARAAILNAEVARVTSPAEVWADGYDAGHQDARAVQPTYPDPTPNPYVAPPGKGRA